MNIEGVLWENIVNAVFLFVHLVYLLLLWLVTAYVIMHGLCYDLFYILIPYGGLMDQWNVYVMYVCKNYFIDVPSDGVLCLPNFMKFYQSVQKLLGGTHWQTDRWSDKPPFIF
jgi:hypothetical protein